jgi:hypothetical protein
LPNGNTLVSTQSAGGAQIGRVIEYTRDGTEVMTFTPDSSGAVYNARRR